MSKYSSLRGMPDITPEEAGIFNIIEKAARDAFKVFEFFEIRTPFLEDIEVFTRSIGENTDIVEKEMYSLQDRGGKNIALRPEGTASIIRAYVEHGWDKKGDITKLFYIGPMFRGERPQKGRLRQFHQIGAEIIGASSPYLDAELILNLEAVLKNMGITGSTIMLNSLGCAEDRASYKKALSSFVDDKRSLLCEDCQRRASTNIMRVLDCKKEGCVETVRSAPRILDFLCDGCAKDYSTLKKILSDSGVVFQEKTTMVRGLDYYTKTIFEVVHSSLGAQDAIGAGGRYDKLVGQMGGSDVGAVGYAIGMERVMLVRAATGYPTEFHSYLGCVLVVAMDETSKDHAFGVVKKLRDAGIPCDMDHSGRSIKGGLRKANKENREYVIIIGENEIKEGKLVLKNMKESKQESLTIEEVVAALKK